MKKSIRATLAVALPVKFVISFAVVVMLSMLLFVSTSALSAEDRCSACGGEWVENAREEPTCTEDGHIFYCCNDCGSDNICTFSR